MGTGLRYYNCNELISLFCCFDFSELELLDFLSDLDLSDFLGWLVLASVPLDFAYQVAVKPDANP